MAAKQVTISEVARMNWGTVAIPASGTRTVILSPANSSTSGTGQVLFGTPSRGQYKLVLSGTGAGNSITIDISSVTTGSSALSIGTFKGIYDTTSIASFPSGSLALPARNAGTQLYLGATASVTSAMTPRALTPSFTITVIIN